MTIERITVRRQVTWPGRGPLELVSLEECPFITSKSRACLASTVRVTREMDFGGNSQHLRSEKNPLECNLYCSIVTLPWRFQLTSLRRQSSLNVASRATGGRYRRRLEVRPVDKLYWLVEGNSARLNLPEARERRPLATILSARPPP